MKIDVGDMILMWLIKKRQSWSYVVLGVMFSVSWKSASNYCDEIQSIFVETFLGRLFYLPYAEDIEQYIPEGFKKRFPDAKLVGDGAHFPAQTPLRFSYNSLTFCIYKWGTTWQLILSKESLSVPFDLGLLTSYFHPPKSSFAVITPDARVVMRSLIYGGKAAEVVHMLNDSAIVARLQGKYFSVRVSIYFFT